MDDTDSPEDRRDLLFLRGWEPGDAFGLEFWLDPRTGRVAWFEEAWQLSERRERERELPERRAF